MIDRYSATPLYLQAAALIRARVQADEWAPGAEMPSERQLAEDIGVSRVTTRKALAELEAEGLILVLPQRGVFRAP
ncbi:winged helix-turn-helix domain-containing protein [Glycomyces arizonensis]|uniref:winged helix-turn-helix domain-containing protein n=1 Tax=Glycomyces arizonensis TaxID=256035 RepID=UPI0004206AB7|nr:winged helix-turn-helix domain-containing protein [Glycomyces arizonensis]